MPVRQIGTMPGGGSGSSSSSSATATKRTQGGRGLLAGDDANQVARSILVGGLLRGRNLDGVQANPEVFTLPCDAILARATIKADADTQQIPILEEVFECDIFEVQVFNFLGFSQAQLAALRGGFSTSPPQSTGVAYPNTVVVPVTQSYGAWSGGFSILVVQPVRAMLQPVDLNWIASVKGPAGSTFDVAFKASCYWSQESAIVTASPSV